MSTRPPPRVLLLAAGVGQRLSPATRTCPKALTEIGGVPLLDRWFEQLERLADEPLEILVNAHHLPCQLAARVALYDRRARSRWAVSYEPTLLGTAGTLRRHRGWLNEDADAIVIYADNYSSIDLRRFHAHHVRRDAAATIALFHCRAPRACGIATVDSAGTMTAFVEKPSSPASNLASAGIHAFRAGLLEEVLCDTDEDLARDVLPRLAGRAVGWHIDGFHYDIGTPEDLALVRRRVAAGEIA